ncbi:hypothetical protein B0H11DRAFT_1901649 [Mycena galericulata]|nr:hypothetical protein B0H11DRAFT_1901649 [Mycena galericulata]
MPNGKFRTDAVSGKKATRAWGNDTSRPLAQRPRPAPIIMIQTGMSTQTPRGYTKIVAENKIFGNRCGVAYTTEQVVAVPKIGGAGSNRDVDSQIVKKERVTLELGAATLNVAVSKYLIV